MKLRLLLASASLLALFACTSPVNVTEGWPLQAMYQTTVQIETQGGWGSGVLIAPDMILTASHVVHNEADIEVTYAEAPKAKVKGTIVIDDPVKDVAVVNLSKPAAVPPVNLACRKPQWGEQIMAVGNPFAHVHTYIAEGIVGSQDAMDFNQRTPTDKENMETLVPYTAQIAPGMSGGPVFDKTGSVLGLNDAILNIQSMFGGTPSGVGLFTAAYKWCDAVKAAAKITDAPVQATKPVNNGGR